ncbi:MAG: long-chain-fatty-acid--CoA ligase [Deltaproteobacteria bacterium]|nr:long-chain-fatty-acid--CoA ligase [Deltaproteobacteria bacterium]MBW2101230.1 long-chain-fatty-acid--CoA ligase [Deltaproteobacteria bacterium]
MLYRDLFREQVNRRPNATALVFEGKETTWRALDSLSNRFARALHQLGLGKDHRVAVLLPNSLELIITYLGLLKQGGIFVPLNFRLTASHIRYAVNHSESRVLICDDVLAPVIEKIRPELATVRQVITIGPKNFPGNMLPFQDFLAMGSETETSTPLEEKDTAIFLYTAGTTGDPKAVVHTHFNCSFVAQHWARAFGMRSEKSVLQVLPLFHAFALHCVTLPALISGTRIIMAEKYSTSWVLQAIEKYGIAILPLVPAMAGMMIHHKDFSRYDLSSPQIALLGGAIVPFELLKKWREAFPKLKIINGYGQTESCPCCTGLWDVDILEKPRSIGKPWDVTQLKILDPEGRRLGPHEVGEIVYKVPCIMKEYFKDPDLTARTVRDGWLYSGDLGTVDEDGYVYIVDRKKDIIIRGGENISSMEVEEVLHKHPDVLEASVIGAPHEVLGETVMAVVVPTPGSGLSEEELISFASERLEHFKVPTHVEFVDQLPRNPGGKVLKRELKKKYFEG